MKGTSPSQASRAPRGLRLTATECQDGEGELSINSPERRNHGYRTRWHRSGKERFAVHGVGESDKPEFVRPEVPYAKRLVRLRCTHDLRCLQHELNLDCLEWEFDPAICSPT